MRIEGKTRFEAAPERVWQVLHDPGVIARCMPGCKELREVEPDRFAATLKLGLGPVSGTYEGSFRICDKVPPESYAMAFEGNGRPGFVKGTARTTLEPDGDATVVAYACDVEVGGLIASVGQRVLKGASSFVIGRMFGNLKKELEG